MVNDDRRLRRLADFLKGKKCESITVIDVRPQVYYSDYFIIATTQSTVHGSGLARSLSDELKNQGLSVHHIEGDRTGEWILIDCFDIMIHLFLPQVRQFYGLDDLYGDLPRVAYD